MIETGFYVSFEYPLGGVLAAECRKSLLDGICR